MSSTRVSGFTVRQQALLDNWHYYQGHHHHSSTTTTTMSVSPPPSDMENRGPLSLGGTTLNINEDDMDCPGYGRRQHDPPALSRTTRSKLGDDCGRSMAASSSSSLENMYNACLAASSSSEGLYYYDDSFEEDVDRKIRAMSVEDVGHHHHHKEEEEEENDGNNNHHHKVQFMLFPFDDDDDEEEEEVTWNWDGQTPKVLTPSASAHSGRPERRASMDSGVLGVWEAKHGLAGAGEWQRNARTEPGTPAEPVTPLASCSVSLEQLVVDSHYVISKLQPLLCTERVNQMTRSYDDIETVTSLLEEKERDLELAARIGQSLLTKNKELTSRKEALEEQLALANETIRQLRHELSKKIQELEVVDQHQQNQQPQDDSRAIARIPSTSSSAVEKLQRKVGSLEEENLSLRMETAQLRSDSESFEEKEMKRKYDSRQQYDKLKEKVETLTEEVQEREKESGKQREEINSLVTRLNDVCQRVRLLTEENTDLLDKLQVAHVSKTQLTRELVHQKDKYDELFETLEKTRDQLRSSRGSKGSPLSCSPDYASEESLASELQKSLSQEASQDEEGVQNNRPPNWKVFETAKAAHKAAAQPQGSYRRLSSSASSCWEADSLMASVLNSDVESFGSDGYGADTNSMCGSALVLGRPGVPGSSDLQTALQRLAFRQGRDLEDNSGAHSDRRSEGLSPFRVPGTPDTMSSSTSGYSYLGCSKNNAQSFGSQYKMSRRLQIIKPMEGSATLQHWQRLAQPHLGGLFERRDGVKVKGDHRLDLDEEAYTLSDFEEDGDETDAADGHPDEDQEEMWSHGDSLNVTDPSSYRHLSVHLTSRSTETSPIPMATSTPLSLQTKRKVTTTAGSGASSYTVSLGLAAILQERDASLAHALMKTGACGPKMGGAGPQSLASGSFAIVPANTVAAASSTAVAGVTATGSSSSSSYPFAVAGPSTEGRDAPPFSSSSSSTATPPPSLFGKLLHSGYSLLWNKAPMDQAPATPPKVPQQTASTPAVQQALAKPQPSATTSTTTTTTPTTPTTSTTTSIPTTSTTTTPTAAAAAAPASSNQVFPTGGTGVLGAITSMRKNGIL